MASLLSLPPGVLAHIGGFLDVKSRNACVLASRELWPVHELDTTHKLSFTHHDDPLKRDRFAETLAHVIEIKPRLNALVLCFHRFGDVNEVNIDISLLQGLHAMRPSIVVTFTFVDCIDAFVRGMMERCVHARVTLVCHYLLAPEIERIVRMMSTMREVYCVRCKSMAFIMIQPDAFDATQIVSIDATDIRLDHPAIDLRGIKTATVELIGDVTSCTVLGVGKLTTILNSSQVFMETQLYESLMHEGTAGLAGVKTVMIMDLFPWIVTDNVWYDIARVLPLTVTYAVSAFNPQCLRFLEYLDELGMLMTSATLLVTSRDTHVAARMVQLMTKKQYPLRFHGDYACDWNVSRIATVSEAYANMSDLCRAFWVVAKYVGN